MKRLSWKIRRFTLWTFLAVLPVGIRLDGEHAAELTVEGHVGTGQVYSIVRDCAGNPVASAKSTYTDQAGAVQYGYRTASGNLIVLGLRGGRLGSVFRPAAAGVEQAGSSDYEYAYWNPHAAVEGSGAGFGVGYIGGAPGYRFDEAAAWFPLSAHLRLGDAAGAHFLTSVNENLPLASGGGYVTMGCGYPCGDRVGGFTGMSGGPYDSAGLLQKVSWRFADRFDLDVNVRWGQAGGHGEAGCSVGVRYHLPLGGRRG